MHFSTLVSTAVLASSVLAFPSIKPEDMARAIARSMDEDISSKNCKDKQTARKFVIPPLPADTSSKKIPGSSLFAFLLT